jgi:hypothetical protein
MLDVVLEAVKNTTTNWRELLEALDNAAIAARVDDRAEYDSLYNGLYDYFTGKDGDNA